MRALKRLAKLKRLIDARAQWMQDHMWLHWRFFRKFFRNPLFHPLMTLWGLL